MSQVSTTLDSPPLSPRTVRATDPQELIALKMATSAHPTPLASPDGSPSVVHNGSNIRAGPATNVPIPRNGGITTGETKPTVVGVPAGPAAVHPAGRTAPGSQVAGPGHQHRRNEEFELEILDSDDEDGAGPTAQNPHSSSVGRERPDSLESAVRNTPSPNRLRRQREREQLEADAKLVSYCSLAACFFLGTIALLISRYQASLAVFGIALEFALDFLTSALVLWRFKTPKPRSYAPDSEAAMEHYLSRRRRRERNSATGVSVTFLVCGGLFKSEVLTPEPISPTFGYTKVTSHSVGSWF